MFNVGDDIDFFVKQLNELVESFRMSLLSNLLSGIGLFGYLMTLNELLMAVSIFSALLSSIVSVTSLYRFFVFLRDRSNQVSSQQLK